MAEYILTKDNDPTAFQREDGTWVHLCDIPMHPHFVPFPYAACYDVPSEA